MRSFNFGCAPGTCNKGETMVEILKFIQPETAFDPEFILSALHSSSTMRGTGFKFSRFARPAYSHAMREVIAKRIIEMAQRGAKDPQTLADDAVRFIAANYNDVCKRPV